MATSLSKLKLKFKFKFKLITFLDEFDSELKQSKSLRWFALGLVLIHFLTAIFWQKQGIVDLIANEASRLCWPFFTSCRSTFILSISQSAILFSIYIGLCFLTIYQYRRNSRHFWYSLLALELCKLGIQWLNYSTMGNYHFMPHILTFIFLFFPHRKLWAEIWIASFYLGAALLKINSEWLSGSSLSWRVPFENSQLLPYLALVGLLIEINAPIFLLAKSRKIVRQLALAALISFHVVSYYWVGFFYPLVMLCVLTIFIPFEFEENFYSKFQIRRQILLVIIWMLFFGNQIIRVFDYKESATDSYKRLASLNMFDASTYCSGFFLISEPGLTVQIPFPNQDLSVRVRCDKIIFDNYLDKLCHTHRHVKAFLSVKLFSAGSWENQFIDGDACRKK